MKYVLQTYKCDSNVSDSLNEAILLAKKTLHDKNLDRVELCFSFGSKITFFKEGGLINIWGGEEIARHFIDQILKEKNK